MSFRLISTTAALAACALSAAAQTLPTATVRTMGGAQPLAFEAQVEAERSSVIAAQVQGEVLALPVRAGERVAAGQVLARIDARAAAQGASAQDAQVAAAEAQLGIANANLARQRQLQAQNYVSRAALDQFEAAQRAAEAQLRAARAQAAAARTQSDFGVLRAPYAGLVASVPSTVGDMALPGKPLLTLYDPARLRVSASVPASAWAASASMADVRVQLGDQTLTPTRVERLPTVDANALTQTVRADLPPGVAAVPGQFARLLLPGMAESGQRAPLVVPTSAIVQRGELSAVYVQPEKGPPQLRQVRLGRRVGAEVEVQAGLAAGERVVTAPAQAR